MLDLNLASLGSVNGGGDEERKDVDTFGDSSGTSDSSVLNLDSSGSGGGGEDSTETATTPFRFDILKMDGDGICDEQRGRVCPDKGFSTRELFPVAGFEGSCCAPDASRVVSFEALGSSSSVPRPHLVDLSFCQADAAARTEMRILQQGNQQVKKSRRGPRSRSSQYRGVTFYRRTGRWESHIWDCGKQVYLGGFDTAHAAARAYDRAAIKFRGIDADINFNLSDYDDDLKQMRNLTKEEFVHILRRQSTGFSRGSSKYRGVTLHKCGRWEARMGQLLGKKAYDKAAIRCNGREAVTNFEPSTYEGEITSELDTDGACLGLDLSLKISQPVAESPKWGNNLTAFQSQDSSIEAADAKKSRAEVPPSFVIGQPYRVAMVPEHSPAWSLPYPGFFSNCEGRVYGRSSDMVPPALSNWTWQVQGATSPLFTSAASSGFSATTLTSACPSQLPEVPYLQAQYPSSAFRSYSKRIREK